MKYVYDFSGKGYAGMNKPLNDVNWTGNEWLSFWITPDGTKNRLVLQFHEKSGEYWEYSSDVLYGTSAQLVRIRLSDFKQPPWGGKVDGNLDLTQVNEFSLYVNKGDKSVKDQGTIYLDNIEIIPEK